MVEWVRSDSNIDQLDNEAVFALDDKATSRVNNEADREADLHQLSSLNLAYKSNSSTRQNTASNSIQGFSRMIANSTLVNNANFGDNTVISERFPKY
jgi:hypothetical protein